MSTMTVAEVMTRNVISVTPQAPFRRVVELLRANRVSALPVVDAEMRPVGIVSEDDVLARERARHPLVGDGPAVRRAPAGERARIDGATAGSLMTAPVVTVDATAPLSLAARRLHDRGVRRLVVVDGQGRLAGVLSRADLLHVYAATDEQLRARVLDALGARLEWCEPCAVEVTVADGTVRLSGRVEFRSDAMALRGLAGGVDGVISVEDELTWTHEDITIPDHATQTRE